MFEYEKENNFSHEVKTSKNYIQKLKDKFSATEKIKNAKEKYTSKLGIKLFSVFGVCVFSLPIVIIPLLPTSMSLFDNITLGAFIGFSMVLLSLAVTDIVYTVHHKKPWFKKLSSKLNFFKKYRQVEQDFIIHEKDLLEIIKDTHLQKELILYLKNLALVEKEHRTHTQIDSHLHDLILMFSNLQYQSAKELIDDNLYYWDIIEKTPEEKKNQEAQKKLEEEATNKFLKSINIKNSDIFKEEFNIKTIL